MSEKQTRREMLASLGRYVALGGLALGVTHLITRKETPTSPSECFRNFKCSRCNLANDCLLPQNRTRSVSEGVPHA